MLAVHGAKNADSDEEFHDDVRIEDDHFYHKPQSHLGHISLAKAAILKIDDLDIDTNTRGVETPTLKATIHGPF